MVNIELPAIKCVVVSDEKVGLNSQDDVAIVLTIDGKEITFIVRYCEKGILKLEKESDT